MVYKRLTGRKRGICAKPRMAFFVTVSFVWRDRVCLILFETLEAVSRSASFGFPLLPST